MSCRSISSSEIVAFEVEADGKLLAADGALAIYIKERKIIKINTLSYMYVEHKGYVTGKFIFQNKYKDHV